MLSAVKHLLKPLPTPAGTQTGCTVTSQESCKSAQRNDSPTDLPCLHCQPKGASQTLPKTAEPPARISRPHS